MNQRYHVPFDVFSMKVDVPVSMFVRDGDVGWSCGQCPLDDRGRVLSANDPVAQARHVCDMIQQTMARAKFTPANLAKLHVYFVPTSPETDAEVLSVFRDRFPPHLIIVPIAVPHFYYDGMMIEVDVFAGDRLEAKTSATASDIALEIVEGPDLIWTTARHELQAGENLRDCVRRIEQILVDHGLGHTHLLSDHWFVPGDHVDPTRMRHSDFLTMPDATVAMADLSTSSVIGTFTFSREPVQLSMIEMPSTDVTVAMRRSGRFVWGVGTCCDGSLDLVNQTGLIMEGLERALTDTRMTFQDVTKLTAHYIGGATNEELHGNMKIRHSYYHSPGPASTGLPVHGLAGTQCRLSVDAFGASPFKTETL